MTSTINPAGPELSQSNTEKEARKLQSLIDTADDLVSAVIECRGDDLIDPPDRVY